MQYGRLAKSMKGILAKYMHRFYLLLAVLRMLYATYLFLTPQSRKSQGTKGFINKLGRIQRLASTHITSAMKTAPMDTIDACADLLPFHLLVEKHTHCTAMYRRQQAGMSKDRGHHYTRSYTVLTSSPRNMRT